jgi:hypothetical protein
LDIAFFVKLFYLCSAKQGSKSSKNCLSDQAGVKLNPVDACLGFKEINPKKASKLSTRIRH